MARLRDQVRELQKKLDEKERIQRTPPANEASSQARSKSGFSGIRHPEEWVSPNSDLRLDSRKSLQLVDDTLIGAFREHLRSRQAQGGRKPTAAHWNRIIPRKLQRFFQKPVPNGCPGISLAEAFVLANWLTVSLIGSDAQPLYSDSGIRQPKGVIRLITYEELHELLRIDPTGERTGLLRRQTARGWLTTSRNPALHPQNLDPEDPMGIGSLTDHRTWVQNNSALSRHRLSAERLDEPLEGRDCILVFQKS